MAIMSKIDPDWQFQINSITRILEKAGATKVIIDRHTPIYPQGYVLAVFTKNTGWEIAGENIAMLTKLAKDKLLSGAGKGEA